MIKKKKDLYKLTVLVSKSIAQNSVAHENVISEETTKGGWVAHTLCVIRKELDPEIWRMSKLALGLAVAYFYENEIIQKAH